ncbi:nitroreductase family deazaflavin-dependent oxidoreductase [Actinomycetospora chibensis]|uniref:Nitroreductase family deazaflavin-dependent oxidoreductase n=1 Tax=Actinomycetospora chibensis TaxID=663606 RepID=A0ABV9RM37_9PSEU|nr:nitroreductase family deazaflavin-dependent oxidoreductase [Actinomycetospora chibensis]MDD7922226.1 nitroreductase family deazaflavin-dependent oxidoreductase [Actinomycetospora chibensis]
MTTTPDTVPKPITPGEEMAALRRFHRDTTWTGTIAEGGMGPGTPAMTATGSGTHRLIQDGRWVVGDYRQDQYLLDGTPVLSWELHWVAGWDPARHEYRATLADCYGHAEVMAGHIDGDRLVFESTGDPVVRIRLTWVLQEPDAILWRNETSVGGGAWSLVEEYRCTPLPGPGGHSGANQAVRTFNKHVLNPLMLRLAGRRHWYAARVEHVGRRTQRAYATPVAARPVPGGFALPLPYGRDTDWCRNLLAAGGGVVTFDGARHDVTAPRIVPADEVRGSFTPYWQRMLAGVPEFVLATTVPAPRGAAGG